MTSQSPIPERTAEVTPEKGTTAVDQAKSSVDMTENSQKRGIGEGRGLASTLRKESLITPVRSASSIEPLKSSSGPTLIIKDQEADDKNNQTIEFAEETQTAENAEPELNSPKLQSPYQKNLLKLYTGKNRGSVDIQNGSLTSMTALIVICSDAISGHYVCDISTSSS